MAPDEGIAQRLVCVSDAGEKNVNTVVSCSGVTFYRGWLVVSARCAVCISWSLAMIDSCIGRRCMDYLMFIASVLRAIAVRMLVCV